MYLQHVDVKLALSRTRATFSTSFKYIFFPHNLKRFDTNVYKECINIIIIILISIIVMEGRTAY